MPVKTAIYDSAISNLLLAAAALLVTTTLQYYLPQRNKYGYLASLVLAVSVIWLLLSRGILMLLLRDQPDYDSFVSDSLLIRFIFGLLVIACMGLVSVLWYTLQDQQETEKRKAEAERLSREAELDKLRQQLQPHFLFNSLNSINALIVADAPRARKMVQQLSDFLRGTLRKEENQWVSLEEELQHLQLYLDIEKVRFGHRLLSEVHSDASAKDARLPAMLLQPVVENAIKFGLYDTTGQITIDIRAWKEDNALVLQVKNPFEPTSGGAARGTGFGLRSVERRLDLLFARKGLLLTSTAGNHFITTIKIPQQ